MFNVIAFNLLRSTFEGLTNETNLFILGNQPCSHAGDVGGFIHARRESLFNLERFEFKHVDGVFAGGGIHWCVLLIADQ